jgi:3-mercaptopyruvate sulfurtransferase SseA
MEDLNCDILIETAVLEDWIKAGKQDLIILDANFKDNDFDKIYKEERIPGARYLNLKENSDPSTSLPNMLPTPK